MLEKTGAASLSLPNEYGSPEDAPKSHFSSFFNPYMLASPLISELLSSQVTMTEDKEFFTSDL